MFINLSNHSSKSWSEKQLKAACEIGGEILDVKFPHVHPEIDEQELEILSEGIISYIEPFLDSDKNNVVLLQDGDIKLIYPVIMRLNIIHPDLKTVFVCNTPIEKITDGDVITTYEFSRFIEYDTYLKY